MKEPTKVIKEIFVLRSLACLGIVLYNTLETVVEQFKLSESADHAVLLEAIHSLQMLLMFSTPMFVYISEFILAKSYGSQIPANFLLKRAKYILAPYVSIAILYSVIELSIDSAIPPTFKLYVYELAKNLLLADFFGYFLLVVFQFYVLHILFVKYVYRRFAMKTVIAWTITINVAYLASFNLFDLTSLPYGNYYIVSFFNKVPFFAWIAYFTISFYCGSHYESFVSYLTRNKRWIIGFVILTGAAVLTAYLTGTIDRVYSKRFDVLFYAIGVIFSVFHYSRKLRTLPAVIVKISQYSFGIFLISRFILFALGRWFALPYTVVNLIWFTIVAFVAAVAASMALTYLLNKFRFGPYVVGRIGVGMPVKKV